MSTTITCIRVGVHQEALTRGKTYEMQEHNECKRQAKVRGDNNRTRWYPVHCFDLNGGDAPVLVEWSYDDAVADPQRGDERGGLVEVRFQLSDGEQRWCTFATPDYLKYLLEPAVDLSPREPGIYGKAIIVVRDVAADTIDRMLRHMDQQGDLAEHSILCADTDDAIDQPNFRDTSMTKKANEGRL